jgi:hypothetical protein
LPHVLPDESVDLDVAAAVRARALADKACLDTWIRVSRVSDPAAL